MLANISLSAVGSAGGLGIHLARVLASSGTVSSIFNRASSVSFHWRAPQSAAQPQVAASQQPWYFVKQEERLPPPVASGDELAIFESSHPSQKFANTLTQLRSHYPNSVWEAISHLFPDRKAVKPTCVDIAVGAEGRGGVELARRGFRAIGVEADPHLLARTFEFAQSHNAHIELMTAKVEHSLLADSTADLLTFFHGLHLVDTPAALREAWRLLKPSGRLVAAWNDRDLSAPFVRELEDIMERHIPTYNRWQKQRSISEWGEQLEEGGMFHLVEYSVHQNPIHMPSASALLDVLDCMSFVRASLHGDARKRFNNDVRALLERRFGRRAFVLPLETKLYVLEKRHAAAAAKKHGNRYNGHTHTGGEHGRGSAHGHRTIFS